MLCTTPSDEFPDPSKMAVSLPRIDRTVKLIQRVNIEYGEAGVPLREVHLVLIAIVTLGPYLAQRCSGKYHSRNISHENRTGLGTNLGLGDEVTPAIIIDLREFT